MGQAHGHGGTEQQRLNEIQKRVEDRRGKIAITGRYHRSPKALSDDYIAESDVLGSGYSGDVKSAKSRSTGKKFAVKSFKIKGAKKSKLEELEQECEIFLGMDHPHIARLNDVYESPDQLTLVMELMSGGELYDRLLAKGKYTERDAATTTKQMLLGLNYMHSHNMVHRDLKLENFLYESKDTDHLKLIDFGFSKIWDMSSTKHSSCGTLSYVAPEVLEGKIELLDKCDLWSIGVLVYMLISGTPPFGGGGKSENQTMDQIIQCNYTFKRDRWGHISPSCQDFVRRTMLKNPQARMSAAKALEHEWITKNDPTQSGAVIDNAVLQGLRQFAHASHFRRACLQMMAWSLSLEERKKVRDVFLAMDKSKEGTIRLGELRKSLTDNFSVEDAEVKSIFEKLDTNDDHEIYYSDFLAAMVQTRIQVHDELLQNTFNRFDVDNSGFITAENLRQVLGESFEGEEIETLLKEADKAGDGKISYKEFVEYLGCPPAGGAPDDRAGRHAEVAARIVDTELRKNPDKDIKKMVSFSETPAKQEKAQGAPEAGQSDGGFRCCPRRAKYQPKAGEP